MSINSYAVGTLVQIQGTFKDLDGNLIDPATVTFEIAQPTKEIDTAATVRVSLGVYTADYIPPIKGGYVYKMAGTGNVPVAAYGSFNATGDF